MKKYCNRSLSYADDAHEYILSSISYSYQLFVLSPVYPYVFIEVYRYLQLKQLMNEIIKQSQLILKLIRTLFICSILHLYNYNLLFNVAYE